MSKIPITGPIEYRQAGQYLYDAEGKMIANVRGWGWIQYLKVEDPEAVQDEIGQFIAEAISEKLERENAKQ